jgi:hypothetical protein
MSTALSVSGLSKSYGGKKAVDNIAFDVRRGGSTPSWGRGAGRHHSPDDRRAPVRRGQPDRRFGVDARTDPSPPSASSPGCRTSPAHDKLTGRYLEFVAGLGRKLKIWLQSTQSC